MERAVRVRTRGKSLAVALTLTMLVPACGTGPAGAVMPDLAGLALDQAEQQLADLAVDVDLTVNRVDDDADADTVLGHQPAPGVALPEGAAVVLRVSDGPTTAGGEGDEDDEDDEQEPAEPVEVPDIVGMALNDAQQALQDAGLRGLRRSTRGTNEAEPGTVLEQSPRAGEMVEANRAVRLVIAGAPKPGDVDQTVGTASVPPAPDGELAVVAHAANVDRIQRLAVVVHNNTSRQVNALEVAATGRSGEGTLQASGATDDVAPAIVPPGGRSLGYIFFSDPPAEGLEWTFSVNPGASFGGGFETNLTVTEVNTSGESIIGSVVNDSGGSVRFARVVYVCFGATGQPTTANSVFTSPIDLTSGQPASFSDEHRTACETYLAASAGQRG